MCACVCVSGKMFRTRDLPMIAEFILMFHKDKPIDWLLDHNLRVKVCNPEKDTVSKWFQEVKHTHDKKAQMIYVFWKGK